ncbi:MAG TPA: hemagglutinin repeat-containing protein, partial [Burkholderiaceae bacterium]|nr:hemagglutinin repeat-containing protein [Burkholderiaceae bacterium]
GGALIAAGNLHLTNSTLGNGGTIRSAGALHIDGARIDNRGGVLHSGGAMSLASQSDIDLTSARLSAQSLALSADGHLLLNTATQSIQDGQRSVQRLGTQAQINTTGDAHIQTGGNLEQHGGALTVGGDLSVHTGGDWKLGTAAWRETTRVQSDEATRSNTDILRAQSARVQVGGQTQAWIGQDLDAQGATLSLAGGGHLSAGRDIKLTAAAEHGEVDSASHSKRHTESRHSLDERLIGTSLSANADLTLNAGQDLKLQASAVSLTQGAATFVADRDIKIQSAQERHETDNFHAGNRGHALKKTTLTTKDRTDQSQAMAASVSAERIHLQSGQDLQIQGSQLVATQNLTAIAARHIDVAAGQHQQSDRHDRQEGKRGIFGGGGLAITIGNQKNSTRQEAEQSIAAATTLGSIEGDILLRAGERYSQTGSHLMTPGGSIDISAQSIAIQAAQESANQRIDT